MIWSGKLVFYSSLLHLLSQGLLSFFSLQMLDRFEQHTLKCSSCKVAYEAFQTWQKILIGATVVCCATAGIPSEIQFRILLAGIGVVSAGIAYILQELQKNFVFIDYVHADVD